jgi:putative hydrolase of the HAD superfamily
MRNLDLYGYGIKGFMLSSIETAIELTDGKFSPNEVRELLALGREMLDHPVELLDGAQRRARGSRALVLPAPGHEGRPEGPGAEARQVGARGPFHAVEIVSEKDRRTYERILQRHGSSPRISSWWAIR